MQEPVSHGLLLGVVEDLECAANIYITHFHQICVATFGRISEVSVMRSLQARHQPSGDQFPWKFCKKFQDEDFPTCISYNKSWSYL
jgi:tRNA(Met) C34 N-acetyltransferase TmcA